MPENAGLRERHCDALVLGAGLAGLSCATALADDGLRVVVLERSAVAGGCARSWRHPSSGDCVDIGHYVVHSEYANFLKFIARLGAMAPRPYDGIAGCTTPRGSPRFTTRTELTSKRSCAARA